MRRKRSGAATRKPLEWAFAHLESEGDDEVYSKRFELGLKDDEVADIWGIYTQIVSIQLIDVTVVWREFCVMISMDPDEATDPSEELAHYDLEILYEHNWALQIGDILAPVDHLSDEKTEDYNPPITVGTDLSLIGKTNASGEDLEEVFWVYGRLYYTRRPATVMELNQILLKRR
jgi:hypothetical protein